MGRIHESRCCARACCGRGYVLVVTLWVMAVLSVTVAVMSYEVRVGTALERRSLDHSMLRLAGRGLIHTAAAHIRAHARDEANGPADKWWSSEELYHDQPIGEASVSLLREAAEDDSPAYGMDDEESRLNINVAEPEHLMAFPGISTVLAESIARYRREREDEAKESKAVAPAETATGADDGDGDGDGDEPRLVDGPITTLSELLNVEGMSERLLFEGREDGGPPLATLLTCISSGRININSAPEAVLTAAGLNEGQMNLVMSQRRQGVVYRSLDEVQSALGIDAQGTAWEHLKRILAVRSNTFRLHAVAVLPGREVERNVAATAFVGEGQLGFVRWREY